MNTFTCAAAVVVAVVPTVPQVTVTRAEAARHGHDDPAAAGRIGEAWGKLYRDSAAWALAYEPQTRPAWQDALRDHFDAIGPIPSEYMLAWTADEAAADEAELGIRVAAGMNATAIVLSSRRAVELYTSALRLRLWLLDAVRRRIEASGETRRWRFLEDGLGAPLQPTEDMDKFLLSEIERQDAVTRLALDEIRLALSEEGWRLPAQPSA